LNNLINTNNWMGTVQLELLLENILELNNPDIWNC
jgi:hypothetical protein